MSVQFGSSGVPAVRYCDADGNVSSVRKVVLNGVTIWPVTISLVLTGVPAGTTVGGTGSVSLLSGKSWSVDWGDGSTDDDITATSLPEHTYSAAGDYTVKLYAENIVSMGSLIGSSGSFMGRGDFPYLTSIVFTAPKITSLGEYCFANCTGLSSVSVPHSAKTVGTGCFHGCTGLISADVTGGVESIGDRCFEGCTSLSSVSIPATVTSIGRKCFRQCSSAISFAGRTGRSSSSAKDDTFGSCVLNVSGTSLPEYCFYNVTSSMTVNIPASVTAVGNGCFGGNTSATINVVSSIGRGADSSVDDTFGKSTVNWIGGSSVPDNQFCNITSSCTYNIPSTVSSIGDNCFKGSLATVKLSGLPGRSASSPATDIFGGCTVLVQNRTSLPENGFRNITSVCTYVIPDTITSIGDSCFSGGSATINLRGATGRSSSSAANDLFGGCTVRCVKSSVPAYAFYNVTSACSVDVASSVTSIGDSAFSGCSCTVNLAGATGRTSSSAQNDLFGSCTVNCTAASIPAFSFYNVTSSGWTVNLQQSVAFIGRGCFHGAGRKVGSTWYYGCNATVNLYGKTGWSKSYVDSMSSSDKSEHCFTFGSCAVFCRATSLDEYEFYGVQTGTDYWMSYDPTEDDDPEVFIDVTDSVMSIGANCFAGSSHGIKLHGKTGRTQSSTADDTFGGSKVACYGPSVPAYSFYNVASYSCEVMFMPSVTSIGTKVGYGATCYFSLWGTTGRTSSSGSDYLFGTDNTVFVMTAQPAYAFYNVKTGHTASSNGRIVFNRNVESLGVGCFLNCDGSILLRGTIGRTADSAAENIFGSSCRIECDVDVPNYWLYNETSTAPVTLDASSQYFQNVTKIGTSAFGGTSTRVINLYGETGRTNTSSADDTFGKATVNCCASSVPAYSFYNITSACKFVITASVSSLGEGCFSQVTGMTGFTNSSTLVTSYPNKCFYGNSAYKYSYSVPSAVTALGDECFRGCTGLTSLPSMSGVTSLGNNCFSDCTGITSVTILSRFATVGVGCFAGCSGMTSASIQSPRTSVPNRCFAYCTKLSSVSIPSSVTTLEALCFYDCQALLNVTLPSGLLVMGDSCFGVDAHGYHCGLAHVSIPASVTQMGPTCFLRCVSIGRVQGTPGVTMNPTTPPTAVGDPLGYWYASGVQLNVPDASLEAYKAADGWSAYASYMS